MQDGNGAMLFFSGQVARAASPLCLMVKIFAPMPYFCPKACFAAEINSLPKRFRLHILVTFSELPAEGTNYPQPSNSFRLLRKLRFRHSTDYNYSLSATVINTTTNYKSLSWPT